jgi:SAM-dependent methyltransferase
MVYEKLLSFLPPARAGARALDVGCGAGRWCRLLTERGYQTTGIDLQQELVGLSRARYPESQFFCASVQDFAPEQPFDLVSCVTVIQHNPFSEQEAIIRKLRTITNPGGHALVLENVRDQAPHVFANSIEEWQTKFERAGFESIAAIRYDYSIFSRLYKAFTRKLVSTARRSRSKDVGEHEHSPEVYETEKLSDPRNYALQSPLRLLDYGAKRLVVAVDGLLEPRLILSNVPLPTVHCGLLFKAR